MKNILFGIWLLIFIMIASNFIVDENTKTIVLILGIFVSFIFALVGILNK